MTLLTSALLVVVAVQAGTLIALLRSRTRLAHAETALRASEEWFRLVADRAPVMIWSARQDSTLDYLNSTCVTFTGRPIQQLLNEGWLDCVHPDDVAHCASIYVPAVERRASFVMEFRLRRADGAYRWVLDSGVPKYAASGAPAGYIGCSIDITERKEAEELNRESRMALEVSHREIHHLAGRLIEGQDAERARIARDLHDDVSQQLAGMSIALSGLKRRIGDTNTVTGLRDEVHALHERTTALAHSVRHLSHDLHPTVLKHAGLVPALTAYCDELQRTHGIELTCTANGDAGTIGAGTGLCLYRVAQETLRNVIAHAGATRAEVRLVRAGAVVALTIADNGRGFDVSSPVRTRGLGLVSITERVRLAGGTIRIDSSPGMGTRVSIELPATAQSAPHHNGSATSDARGLDLTGLRTH